MILPQHQLFAWLHLHNSYPGLILPGLVAPFGVFFMTTYMRGIPRELDEAAMLDGASRWTIFRRVILPLTIPAQSTLAVFTFLGAWNDYWWPLISATRSDMYTLTVGLAAAQMNYAQTSGLGYLMAQAVFASIPIFIVYIIFQKQIVRAMAGNRGPMKRVARRIAGAARARQLREGRPPDAPLPAALLRRVRRRIWRQHRRRQGGGRVRDHHYARQPLQRRKSRHPDRCQRRRLARLSAAHRAGRRARPARSGDDARRRDQRLCVEGPGRAGRWLSARGRDFAERLHRRRAAGRDDGRSRLRHAVGHARRPVPRQHRAVRQGRADARRQAGPSEHVRTNCSHRRASSSSAPASPISSRATSAIRRSRRATSTPT